MTDDTANQISIIPDASETPEDILGLDFPKQHLQRFQSVEAELEAYLDKPCEASDLLRYWEV